MNKQSLMNFARTLGYPDPVEEEWPEMEQLNEWVMDSACEATDGCMVEPDGKCHHGHASWLLYMGLI